MSVLSETCRLFPVVSGPRAESVLIPAPNRSRPILTVGAAMCILVWGSSQPAHRRPDGARAPDSRAQWLGRPGRERLQNGPRPPQSSCLPRVQGSCGAAMCHAGFSRSSSTPPTASTCTRDASSRIPPVGPPTRRPLPGADPASARPWRPHQRIRAGRLKTRSGLVAEFRNPTGLSPLGGEALRQEVDVGGAGQRS